MPALAKLSITNLRNISSGAMKPGPQVNIVHGENGSGKTSILEAIHLLGLARSFRSTQLKPIIQAGQNECTVFAELRDGNTIGITKVNRGIQQVRIGGSKAENTAQLAHALPLQLINADTFKILEGNPGIRRNFMDWGVFHVEQLFIDNWRQAQRALHHRNNLLRNGAKANEIAPWTEEVSRYGTMVDNSRATYLNQLLPVLSELLAELAGLNGLVLEYDRGWERGSDLSKVLNQGLERDRKYGYTVLGPQRADLKIRLGPNYAVDTLSRGQQKLLVIALKIAQGKLLQQQNKKNCLFLIDDLPAELDRKNRARVGGLLSGLDCQVFITCVERSALEGCWPKPNENKLFHVKHGKINALDEA